MDSRPTDGAGFAVLTQAIPIFIYLIIFVGIVSAIIAVGHLIDAGHPFWAFSIGLSDLFVASLFIAAHIEAL